MITAEEALHLAKKYHDTHGNSGGTQVYCDSTAGWSSKTSLVSERGAIYIYTDKTYLSAGGDVTAPGVKIGDGLAYVVDLPFQSDLIGEEVLQEVAEMSGSVTEQERQLWNNKVSAYLLAQDTENLVLSKTNYVVNGDIFYG